jgi:small acid-soluble spore protein D (minor alpha/beta-type SASP)
MKGGYLMSNKANTPMSQFKADVMRKKGYHVDPEHPDQVKYEVADEVDVPLKKGYNGDLTSKQAGKVGGNIGGPMVQDLIKMAKAAFPTNQK